MKIFAISDLHLSAAVQKPMDIFGDGWENHFEKISADWLDKVGDGDVVLLGGDMSWGMNIPEAAPDYALVAALPGRKIVVKGNHDYYWTSLSKMRASFPQFDFIQNDALRIEAPSGSGAVVAGSRGWTIPNATATEEDKKIYQRELVRLELSLKQAEALKRQGDLLIALLHFPPFDADFAPTAVTELLHKYGVKICVYGHLHGKKVRSIPRFQLDGTTYLLTSCDLVCNKLTELAEL